MAKTVPLKTYHTAALVEKLDQRVVHSESARRAAQQLRTRLKQEGFKVVSIEVYEIPDSPVHEE